MRRKPEISLRARALRYLARREYSRAELHNKLSLYAQEGDDLEAVLDDLAARGWLSDARAAAQLVHAKRSRFGMQRIVHELQQKGITDNLIDAALPELKQSELDVAREVWRKKFDSIPGDAKEKARQIRFLQSRGFSVEVIFKVLRLAEAET